MSELTKFWYLKQINLFSEMTREEMQMMADMTTMSSFPAKEVLYFPGDPSDSVFLLKEGNVKISQLTPDGKKLTLDILNPGELFGEAAITGPDAERDTMAEALTPVHVCIASKDRFMQFLNHRPALVMRITKIMGFRLKRVETKLQSLLFKSVPARLAELLIRLAADYGKETGASIEIGLKLTHQEMAELIGSTRETTSAIMGQFRDKKLIDTDGRRIVVLNRQKLSQTA